MIKKMGENKKLFCLVIVCLFVLFSLTNGVYALTADITLQETEWFTANKAGYWGGSGFTSLNNFTVPLPVFFEGWKSSPRDEIINYQWNFGDGSPIVSAPGQFNAAHVYETPGSYTATLIVTDTNGATASTSIQIIARNRATEFLNKIRYIDSVIGSDTCLGTSPTVNSATDCPWKTADKAFSGLSTGGAINNFQYLFNRGQTFTYSQSYSITSDIGVYYGAYGTGANPVIQPITSYNGDLFLPAANQAGVNYLRFSDLEFRGGTGGSFFKTSFGGIYNTLFLRINITGYFSPFIFQGMARDNSQWTNSRFEDGIFLIDSSIFNSTNIGFSAFNVNKLAIINTTVDHSNNHNIYTASIDRAVINNLVSTSPAFGRAALRLAGGINSTWPSQNIYIGRNYFGGWVDPINGASPHNGGGNRYNWLLVQFSPQSQATSGQSRDELYYTIESNVFTNGELLLGISSAENFTIRNNIFITNNTNSNGIPGTANLLQIGFADAQAFGSGESDQKASKNINVIGNTFIQRNGATSIIKIENYSYNSPSYIPYKNHLNISIKNNLFYLASGAGGTTPIITINRNDPNLIANISSNNNVFFFEDGSQSSNLFNIGQYDGSNLGISYNLAGWQTLGKDVNSIYINPLFNSYLTNSLISNGNYLNYNSFGPDLKLQTSSPAINKGISIPNLLFYDYNGNLRDNLPDIGAFENIVVSPPAQICGNNIKEGTEVCDGSDLNSQTCLSQGFSSGTLSCAGDCLSFVNSQCVASASSCPNNQCEAEETCSNCPGDCGICSPLGGGGGGGGGGPIENINSSVTYTGKNLNISGIILNNNQSSMCNNCNLNITFNSIEKNLQTNVDGKFNVKFTNINFSSGIYKIYIKHLDNNQAIINRYEKEIYII